MPALAIRISWLRGSNTAYWMAAWRRGMPRIISLRFKVARTSQGEVPVLCTPRNVPTASAAYSAAGSPLPGTSHFESRELLRVLLLAVFRWHAVQAAAQSYSFVCPKGRHYAGKGDSAFTPSVPEQSAREAGNEAVVS